MTNLIEYNGEWYMWDGGNTVPVKLQPQPKLQQMRWTGHRWEIHMGYPHGHDVPRYNLEGKWLVETE